MYLNHFGLTDSPFKITPHTEVFFEGAQRGEILDALVYAVVEGEGLIKVTGEVGTGKTMLCRMLAERLPNTVEIIYLAIPSLTRDEMLAAIAEDLGLDEHAHNGSHAQQSLHTPQLLRALQTKLIALHEQGRRVVVLIDEAHAMPLESLEEIRLLSNLETQTSKLMQIVLFGQPELDSHLSLSHMRQLKERITQSFKLEPLSEGEVHQYLNFRLRAAGYRGPELFDPKCTRILTRASQGLSRRINILADKTLLAAFADNTHDVEPAHVKAAIRDSEFRAPRRAYTPKTLATIGLLGLILGGILTWAYTHYGRPINAATIAPGSSAPSTTVAVLPTPPSVAKVPASPPPAAPAPTATASSATRPTAAPAPAPAVVAASATSSQAVTIEPVASAPVEAVAVSEPSPAQPLAAAEPSNVASEAKPAPDLPAWEASRDWMQAQPANTWVIQLMLSNFADTGERSAFLARARTELGEDRLHQYRLQLYGNNKIGVLYGPFPDRSGALNALLALPPELRQYRPYLRSVGVVRQEAIYN